MITTRFNTNILTAARKLQASRTVATAAGDASQRLTSARLADYENTAIRRILLEEYSSLGIPGFVATLPWYVRTSPEVIVTGPPIDLPADGWMVESVVAAGVKFRHALPHQIAGILAGTERVLVPSAAEPVWWQEEGFVQVRPALVATPVTLRYIRRHEDLAVLDSPATSGKINLAPGTYVAATKTITVSMNVALSSADINKRFSFYDGAIVYDGFVVSVPETTALIAGGDALPSVNKTVVTLLLSDNSPGDILLPDSYDPRIVAYMVEAALTDAKLNQ